MHDVFCSNGSAGEEVRKLSSAMIHDGQHFKSLVRGEPVVDEVHGPDIIPERGLRQGFAQVLELASLTNAKREFFEMINPLGALMVDGRWPLFADHVVKHGMAIGRILASKFHQALPHISVAIRAGLVPPSKSV